MNKKFFLILLLFLLFSPVFCLSETHWWKLNEGSGNLVIDYGVGGDNLIISGPSWSVSGGKVWETALVGDGVNDYAEATSINDLEDQEVITVCAWVRVDSWTTGRRWFVVSTDSGTRVEYHGIIERDYFKARYFDFGAGDIDAVDSNRNRNNGEWYWVCEEFNTVNDSIKVWVNNVLEETTSHAGMLYSGDNVRATLFAATSSAVHANVAIQDFRIFNQALTSEDRVFIYNNGQGTDYSLNSMESVVSLPVNDSNNLILSGQDMEGFFNIIMWLLIIIAILFSFKYVKGMSRQNKFFYVFLILGVVGYFILEGDYENVTWLSFLSQIFVESRFIKNWFLVFIVVGAIGMAFGSQIKEFFKK